MKNAASNSDTFKWNFDTVRFAGPNSSSNMVNSPLHQRNAHHLMTRQGSQETPVHTNRIGKDVNQKKIIQSNEQPSRKPNVITIEHSPNQRSSSAYE